MKISSLKKLTKGDITVHKFMSEIKEEINEYSNFKGKKGASIPIQVDTDEEFIFESNDLKSLCSYFVQGQINSEELSYIADAVELSSNIYIPDDKVKDFVFEMTDPEVNGPFTHNRANEILNSYSL